MTISSRADFRRLALKSPHGLLGSGFGSGLSPVAPGTVGSAAALLPWWAMAQLPLWAYGLVLVLAFLVGIWACERCGQDLEVDDHGGLVWDEFVGQWLALAAMPLDWRVAVAGFLLFRLFDIWKPFPVRQLERRVPGGLGVMLDDLVAGAYAWLVLFALLKAIGWA